MAITPTINDIREITPVLSKKLNIDFTNYAFSFLRRRFGYLFNILNIKSTAEFIEGINTKELIEEFSYRFHVSDTEMFRDPSFWRYLRLKLLSSIDSNNLSFWIPQAVSNEELFSLLVILKEEDLIKKAKVYCNVESSKKVDEIKSGVIDSKKIEINKQNFKRLELESSFDDYFIKQDGKLNIDLSLLSCVEFINDNYFNQTPPELVSMVLFRNRMLFYNSKLQVVAEEQVVKNIKNGGYLAIGLKENISQLNQNFIEEYDKGEKIFKV